MVPKGGFEPPRGLPTTPSRWRVYQFHHFGTECWNKAKAEAINLNLSLKLICAARVQALGVPGASGVSEEPEAEPGVLKVKRELSEPAFPS